MRSTCWRRTWWMTSVSTEGRAGVGRMCPCVRLLGWLRSADGLAYVPYVRSASGPAGSDVDLRARGTDDGAKDVEVAVRQALGLYSSCSERMLLPDSRGRGSEDGQSSKLEDLTQLDVLSQPRASDPTACSVLRFLFYSALLGI
jgi:hypothetical protein